MKIVVWLISSHGSAMHICRYPDGIKKDISQLQSSQKQDVKFQDPIFTEFQKNFRTFLSVSRGSIHRKCTFFCPHKCYSL